MSEDPYAHIPEAFRIDREVDQLAALGKEYGARLAALHSEVNRLQSELRGARMTVIAIVKSCGSEVRVDDRTFVAIDDGDSLSVRDDQDKMEKVFTVTRREQK